MYSFSGTNFALAPTTEAVGFLAGLQLQPSKGLCEHAQPLQRHGNCLSNGNTVAESAGRVGSWDLASDLVLAWEKVGV